jgi:NADPH:quinone reductase-like Zn-dependent oxidoreductase
VAGTRKYHLAWLSALALWLITGGAVGAADNAPQATRRIVFERADKAYRLKLTQGPVAGLGDHQVLVHMRAVALNRGDWEVLATDPGVDINGRIAGSDGAGDVVAVGPAVRGFHRGDRVTSLYFRNWTDGPPDGRKLSDVIGLNTDGVFGDLVVLDDTAVATMPATLTYTEAATLPTAWLTAWSALTSGRKLRPGDVVLVQGTGGVSAAAIQLGAAMGARVVVTSSSDAKFAQARALGARDAINYRTTPEWSKQVRDITGQHGADLVVDVGGARTLEQSVRSLAYQGGIAIVGGLTGYDGAVPAAPLLEKVATAYGVFVGSRADYYRMSRFIITHRIHPAVDRVYRLEEFAAAVAQLKSGDFVGKIVLQLQ